MTLTTDRAPDLSDVAARHGLDPACARPTLATYLRQLWGRRHFVLRYSQAASARTYSRSILGQAWQILTPLLNAGVYYLIFGLGLKTNRGIDNFAAFLIIGLFVFHFMQHSVQMAANSVNSNLNLVRTLRFPRASLPLGTTVYQYQRLLVSMVALLPIILLTGERPTVKWLLAVPALVLVGMFTFGVSLVVARMGWRLPDTVHVLPFVLRSWLFASGIFYSIDKVAGGHAPWIGTVMHLNPGALYVDLMRSALLSDHQMYRYDVPAGLAWAVAAVVIGTVVFWWSEQEYGRG